MADIAEIVICALTYRRPEGLRRLLSALRSQKCPMAARLRIVIVDNDAGGSAAPICEEFVVAGAWPISYRIESQPGIACARNAALRQTVGADWIAFVDDDEVPEPDWLERLVATQRHEHADVVAGPVVPYFDGPVEPWIRDGGFFNRRRHRSGTRLGVAYTNNVLFRRKMIDEMQLRFDEQWALMGCEDHAFFLKIARAGYKLVWSDDAVVTEWIPRERARPGWLIRRHYRVGNCTSLVEIDVLRRWWTRPLLGARSSAWLVRGTAQLLAGLPNSPAWRLRGRMALAYAAGLATGLAGVRYQEYRR